MKLIDKDALVAEIERRRDLHYKYYMKNGVGSIAECKYDEDRDILSFIDTLEAKEVDLEKEVDLLIKSSTWAMANREDFLRVAKHFLERGLSASNLITAADKGTAEEIIINLKRVEKDYRIDLTKEIEWVRNKAQKGE